LEELDLSSAVTVHIDHDSESVACFKRFQSSEHDSGATAIPDVNIARHILYQMIVPFSIGRDKGTSCGSESSFPLVYYFLHSQDHFFTRSSIGASRMDRASVWSMKA
jgi:hypothetical protein